MIKKTITICIIIILFITAAIFYLNSVLLPKKAKSIIIDKLSKQLHRKVEIDQLRYSLFKGIEIKNLVIYDLSQFGEEIFLKAENVSFKILILPLIFKKQVVLPNINVDKMHANVIREDNNLFNISDLQRLTLNKEAKKRKKFGFVTFNLTIKDSEVNFLDNTFEPKFHTGLSDLNAKINLTFPAKAKFNIDAKIKNHLPSAAVKMQGVFDIEKNIFTCSTNLRKIDLLKLPYLTFDIFSLNKSTFHEADFDVKLHDKFLDVNFKKTDLDLDFKKNKFAFSGKINLQSNLNLNLRNLFRSDFNGLITLSSAKFSGIKFINDLTDINGVLSFSPEAITTENLKGQAFDTTLTAKGSLTNYFRNPKLNLFLSSDVNLSKLQYIFPKLFQQDNVSIEGNGYFSLNLNSYIRKPGKYTLDGTLNIAKATANITYLREEIINIKGPVNFIKNEISWKNITGKYKNKEYNSTGSLKNIRDPDFDLVLTSDNLNLDTNFGLRDRFTFINILNLKGTYFDSDFNFAGNVDLSKKLFKFTSEGKANLSLADLKDIFPVLSEKMDKTELKGVCEINAMVSGETLNWRNFSTKLDLRSEEISINNLKLNHITASCNRTSPKAADIIISAQAYNGEISLAGKIDPEEKITGYVSDLNIRNLDISTLKQDTTLKNKKLSGLLSTNSSISGYFEDLDTLNGFGKIWVKDGNLWQVDLLKGLGNALSIPLFEEITFTEAYSDFTIKERNISSENLRLDSEELIMLAEGNIDFDGNINFTVGTESKKHIIQDSENISDVITSLPAKASQFLTVKITGNIKSPKYIPIPSPTRILKKFKNVLEGILK